MRFTQVTKKHTACVAGHFVFVMAATLAMGAATAWAANVSNIEFGQLDWYENGSPHTLNSVWGTMSMDVFPDSTDIFYLNVLADASVNPSPGSSNWIIQNMPIFPTAIGNASSRQSVDFNLEDLGIFTGGDLSLMDVNFTLTDVPEPAFGATGTVITSLGQTVASLSRDATGAKNGVNPIPLPANIGRPAGQKAIGAATDVIQHKDVPEVQEGRQRCLAGSTARSIKWLDQQHNLMSGKTAQQIYDDLVGLKVGSSGPGSTSYEQDVSAKASYLQGLAAKKRKTAKTKVLDLDNSIGNVKGVDETTGVDLITWLRQELPTEDVELHYDGHIITVTGIYKQDGMEYIKYRDDEKQGPDSNTVNNDGDKKEKSAKLTKVGNDYFFREDGAAASHKVKVVISESITPERPEGIDSPLPVVPPNRGRYALDGGGPTYLTTFGTVVLTDVQHFGFHNVQTTPLGMDELELFDSTLQAMAQVPGVGLVPLTLTGQVQVLVLDRLSSTTGYFETEMLSMSLSSGPITLPGIGLTEILVQESPTMPSLGLTGIHDMFDGNYFIDSFFDVFTELSLDGGFSYSPALNSERVVLNIPEPCSALIALLGVAMAVCRRSRLQSPKVCGGRHSLCS